MPGNELKYVWVTLIIIIGLRTQLRKIDKQRSEKLLFGNNKYVIWMCTGLLLGGHTWEMWGRGKEWAKGLLM
jgi:hypothetical protein